MQARAGTLTHVSTLLAVMMGHSNQGIDKPKGEEQPTDKQRAQTAHETSPRKSVSREETRDRKLSNSSKTSGAS
jgi:hypothetical protein